ncbi:MAG: UDP-N-acetylmuramoyl-L-alanyl-D-glutamate--2,6-diaminopimelate ligase, partial [Beijerinckiaceae bacterium]
MALRRLADLVPSAAGGPAAELSIDGVALDSRKAGPGFAFFAVPGTKADGLQFAPQAIAAGARAIVCERLPDDPEPGVAYVQVADVRAALAHAAAAFHARQPETIVAVTGTSGKTSVAAFVRQIWLRLGHQAAALGTTGVIAPSGAVYGSLTTPDPVSLHKTLADLAGDGVTHLAMEASSHGLDQRRLDGVRLKAGAFTNLSRDHLDYHPTLDDYLAAKLRLFTDLLPPGAGAVVNADSDVADTVLAACRERGLNVLTCGERGALRLADAKAGQTATDITVTYKNATHTLRLPLAGAFMASNALVAAGLCILTGSDAEAVFAALEHLQGAPGRLEQIGARNGAPVFVDYAHKPDALEKVLQALRPLTRGRLVVVFGCGGDRDKGKRPIMGAIAAREADVAIVTDDNPRSEEPAQIRREILAAAPGAIEIGDRAMAIAAAVAMLEAGDVLIVAGKGHETGQIVGDRILPFSDHESVREA